MRFVTPKVRRVALIILAGALPQSSMAETTYIVDDRSLGDRSSPLGTSWRLVTDGVMGGVSQGQLTTETVDGRECLRLRGEVSLDNNGGFVQTMLDLSQEGSFDAAGYSGVEVTVYGNGETYNVHLRTSGLWLPWQSYRASFEATPAWTTLKLPFSEFVRYRTNKTLNLSKLKRLGIVAIGREFNADVCIAGVAFYR